MIGMMMSIMASLFPVGSPPGPLKRMSEKRSKGERGRGGVIVTTMAPRPDK